MLKTLLLVTSICLPLISGCCCACNNPFPLPNTRSVGGSSGDTDEDDGMEAEDKKTAEDYAQRALSNVDCGDIQSAHHKHDGLNWYVTGTCEGPEGSRGDYEVQFLRTLHGNRYSWDVQEVTFDGESLFSK